MGEWISGAYKDFVIMPDLRPILEASSGALLTIRTDGPPRYVGDHDRRILIEGNAAGFQMLATTLLAMAEAVESDSAIRPFGWHLVLNPEDLSPLMMDEGYQLVLNCEE